MRWPGWKAGLRNSPRMWSDKKQLVWAGRRDQVQEPIQRPRDWGHPTHPSPPGLGSHADPGTSPLPCRCWVRDPWVHSILVMGYSGLTCLFNLVVLVWALRVLHRLRARDKVPSTRACRDSVTVLGLTVLLGTTWILAFFSFDVFLLPQLFLFTTFSSLYGRARASCAGSPGG